MAGPRARASERDGEGGGGLWPDSYQGPMKWVREGGHSPFVANRVSIGTISSIRGSAWLDRSAAAHLMGAAGSSGIYIPLATAAACSRATNTGESREREGWKEEGKGTGGERSISRNPVAAVLV